MRELGILIPILALSIPIVAILAGNVTKVMKMRHDERMAQGKISEEDAEQWRRTVERLERRVKVLESILDDQVPGWRRKHDD